MNYTTVVSSHRTAAFVLFLCFQMLWPFNHQLVSVEIPNHEYLINFLNQIEEEAQTRRQEIETAVDIDPNFYTLSPGLVKSISRSFYLLKEVNPELLENGCYMDFGLYKGYAFWFCEQFSRDFTSSTVRHYGFDSFEGLPSSSIDYYAGWEHKKAHGEKNSWYPGQFACSLEEVKWHLFQHGVEWERIELIKGWFGKDLFQQFASTHELKKLAIVVIDSDTYESCIEVLDFISDQIVPGTILLLDEYNVQENQGEKRAFREYCQRHPHFSADYLFSFGDPGYLAPIGGAFIVRSI